MTYDFTWRDGERLVRFASGAVAEASGLLREHGFVSYALLTTERAAGQAPALSAGADAVHHVPTGRVDEISAALLPGVGEQPLVALGGGRVVDTAKALAGVTGAPCAALPTTLSGAELTPFHRLPAGVQGARSTRPALVVADPALMASAPGPTLAASAMNALAHAMEALYTPLANPVSELAALRAARLLVSGLDDHAEQLALGAVLAGYASGAAGLAVHHAVCQAIVRTSGAPHAETNAVMLPHFVRLMAPRAPQAMAAFASAVGEAGTEPEEAADLVARLASRCGHTRLGTLGVGEGDLPAVVDAVQGHRGLSATPDPPGELELLALLSAAL